MNAANWSIMKFNPEARAFVESEPQRALFRQLDRAREETESLSWAEQDAYDKEFADAMEHAPEDWVRGPEWTEAELEEYARLDAMKHKGAHEL